MIPATQKAFRENAFCIRLEERLRDEDGDGTIVVIRVGHVLRVELDLVVEVEVRSVAEGIVPIIGNMPLSTHNTGGRGLLFFQTYILLKPPEFNSTASLKKENPP